MWGGQAVVRCETTSACSIPKQNAVVKHVVHVHTHAHMSVHQHNTYNPIAIQITTTTNYLHVKSSLKPTLQMVLSQLWIRIVDVNFVYVNYCMNSLY